MVISISALVNGLKELDDRIYNLGHKEAERRLGRKIDKDWVQGLYSVGPDGSFVRTVAYTEALAKLS